MNQPYFLKNLPAPLQFWIRPILLISLALHGLLLGIPIPAEKKPTPVKKEPEKVKITQLPTKSSAVVPKATPSAAVPKPKPSPVMASPIRPRPQPIRQAALDIPPVPPRAKVIPRPQPQPTPQQKNPSPTPSPTPAQTPPLPTAIETPSPSTPAPTPDSTVKDPNADFPIYPNAESGSVGLLVGEIDKAARHTTDGLDQVVAFYSKELPARKFNPKPLTDEAELKVYEVSKEGGTPQYLHLISKDGKTVILLASQQVPDLKSLKSAEARNPEEIAFYDNVLKPLENDEKLVLSTVEPGDIAKVPDAAKFADTNKFQFRAKTGRLSPKSPEELFAIYEAQLSQNGFAQISKEASYGGALTYKITQGKFTTYMYFVVNTDNNTIVILSKDSPF